MILNKKFPKGVDNVYYGIAGGIVYRRMGRKKLMPIKKY